MQSAWRRQWVNAPPFLGLEGVVGSGGGGPPPLLRDEREATNVHRCIRRLQPPTCDVRRRATYQSWRGIGHTWAHTHRVTRRRRAGPNPPDARGAHCWPPSRRAPRPAGPCRVTRYFFCFSCSVIPRCVSMVCVPLRHATLASPSCHRPRCPAPLPHHLVVWAEKMAGRGWCVGDAPTMVPASQMRRRRRRRPSPLRPSARDRDSRAGRPFSVSRCVATPRRFPHSRRRVWPWRGRGGGRWGARAAHMVGADGGPSPLHAAAAAGSAAATAGDASPRVLATRPPGCCQPPADRRVGAAGGRRAPGRLARVAPPLPPLHTVRGGGQARCARRVDHRNRARPPHSGATTAGPTRRVPRGGGRHHRARG